MFKSLSDPAILTILIILAILTILVMITIIHGDDEVTSRKYFNEQKDKSSVLFDAETLTISELEQTVAGSLLFDSTNKILIDGLFFRKAAKNFDEITEVLNKKSNADIYIWSDKILSAKQLGVFPKANIKLFKIPQNIWAFLDGIRPAAPNNVLLFHKAAETNEPEIIFAMIIRQFRLMLGLAENSKESIDEVKRLAPWQRSKLQKQSLIFGQEKLKEIYKKIYKIDKSQKTGKTNLTLVQNIDILLLDL